MEGSEEYKCDICGMVFVNDTELARHQKFVHENNAILMCFGVR
jgi:C2H2 type zinc finger protein